MLQEPLLFDRSIMDNIRVGKPDASDAQVMQAAAQANAASFIGVLCAILLLLFVCAATAFGPLASMSAAHEQTHSGWR